MLHQNVVTGVVKRTTKHIYFIWHWKFLQEGHQGIRDFVCHVKSQGMIPSFAKQMRKFVVLVDPRTINLFVVPRRNALNVQIGQNLVLVQQKWIL